MKPTDQGPWRAALVGRPIDLRRLLRVRCELPPPLRTRMIELEPQLKHFGDTVVARMLPTCGPVGHFTVQAVPVMAREIPSSTHSTRRARMRTLIASRFDQIIANGVAHETGERG